jgi:hypothetical protein
MHPLMDALATNQEQTGIAAKCFLGVASTFGAVGISLATVISWLQVISLVIGIAVGLATLRSIAKGKK